MHLYHSLKVRGKSEDRFGLSCEGELGKGGKYTTCILCKSSLENGLGIGYCSGKPYHSHTLPMLELYSIIHCLCQKSIRSSTSLHSTSNSSHLQPPTLSTILKKTHQPHQLTRPPARSWLNIRRRVYLVLNSPHHSLHVYCKCRDLGIQGH